MNSTARDIAYDIIRAFETYKTRLDRLEDKYNLNERLSRQDKKLAKNLINGTVRHLSYLDWVGAQLYHGKYKKLLVKIKTVLRLALYELIFLKHIPARATINEYVKLSKTAIGYRQSKMVNAILRNFTRGKAELDPGKSIGNRDECISVKYSFPIWLVKRWIELWGVEEAELLCAALNQVPDFDLRINTEQIKRDEFVKLLDSAAVAYRNSVLSSDSVKVTDIQAIIENGWFEKGYCSLQDESASIPVRLLGIESGDFILDVCSAPGGKLTQILEEKVQNVAAVAVDIDISRLKKVRENVKRLKKGNTLFVAADGRALPFKPVFDKILLDVPCSGLGVIRKHPDIKWRRTMDEIVEFSQIQRDILKESSKMLKKSGLLVYSTCTLDPQENIEVVREFLEDEETPFILQKPKGALGNYEKDGCIQTFPPRDDMDGAFCALFKNG
jgi:16S rRNA (cytosine967-C5)-methyltransferase